MSFLSGVSITCFAASYAISLLLEVSRLFFQMTVRNVVMVSFAGAGLVAHTIYLYMQSRTEMASGGLVPLASWYDFCLLAAWVVAAVYLGLSLRRPQNALGLFLLPVVLGLVVLAFTLRDVAPFNPSAARNLWRSVHGLALLLGTAAGGLGFAAGGMYLVQAYRLKHKLPPKPGFRLPSLEWLQRFNRDALVVSTTSLAVGLVSGVLLNMSSRGGTVSWSDPVVWSSAVLFGWLLAVLIFESVYRPARQGQKVAYLTLASFVFLLMALAFVLVSRHATPAAPPAVSAHALDAGGAA